MLRATGYVFSARLADRWQAGRVFLLGDAAHLTPPFVGQGLGAGVRDAANLAWKLARVLHGQAPEALLATYALERRPHVRSQIRLARTAGWAMTGGQDRAAAVRRVALRALVALPSGAAGLLDTGSPALRGPLAGRRRPGRGPRPGTLAPQPQVRVAGRVVPLDEALGRGFAVLTRDPLEPGLRAVAEALGARVLALDGGPGPLSAWLGPAGAVLLRPDRAVLLSGPVRGARVRAVLELVGAGGSLSRGEPSSGRAARRPR